MKKVILPLVLLISFALQSTAQTKKDSIKQLFGLMHQDSLISKSFEIMTNSVVKSMSTQIKDADFQKKYAKIMEKSMGTSQKIAMRLVNEDLVDIYDKYFTQEEINDFIVFYKSKSGQKMINKITDIQKDLMEIMAAKYTPTLQQELMKEFETLLIETSEQE